MRHGKIITLSGITLSAAALALAGCGPKTATTDTNTTTMTTGNDMAVAGADGMNTAAPMASPGQTFANAAAASDAFEIASSQLAATNGKAAAIKTFASKMIAAHTDSTAKLKTAAASAAPAIIPDPTMTAAQEKKLADLKGMMGADFDKAYAAAQTDAHQMTLDKLKDYAASGDVPQLKTFATGLVPIVTAHLNMAKGLKA